jgi:hypothetical protein
MENPTTSNIKTNEDAESIANDILIGAQAIADERGESIHQVYKAFAAGKLVGAWKDGKEIRASKRAMRRHHHSKAARSGL